MSVKNNEKKKKITINYTDVNVDKLSFTDLEDNDRSKGQKIAYPRYDHPKYGNNTPLCIQFPWIYLEQYGIPKINEWCKEDSDRLYIKIPLDLSDPIINEFCNLIKMIDSQYSDSKYAEKILGPKYNKYKYQPILRYPGEEDDSDNKKKKKNYGPKLPNMKLKLDYTYPDLLIETKVFASYLDDNNERIRTKINDIKSVDDIAKHIKWKTKIRPIGQIIKLWAQNPSKNDPTYGLTFKLIQIEYEPSEGSGIHEIESDGFLDSDKETNNKESKLSSKESKLSSKESKLSNKEESKFISSDKEESKSSSSTDNNSNTKNNIKKKVLVESESESESDNESDNELNESKQKKINNKTEVIESESDNSDNSDDSDEIKPAKKVAPKAKTKNKK